jgi:hypothetical protein
MKLTRLFSFIASIIPIWYPCVSATETFQIGDETVAVYDFVKSDEFGTGLIVHSFAERTGSDGNDMVRFGEYIRKQCQTYQTNLRVLGTRDLIYSFDRNYDLTIEVNGRCKDFNIHKWALTALGIGEFSICDEGPSYLHMCWEFKTPRDIIIKDRRISASEYCDPHVRGNGWTRFTHQSPNFCRKLILMNRVYSYDDIPQIFGQ